MKNLTEKHDKMSESFYIGGVFIFPCCGEKVAFIEYTQYEKEEKTQIYCPYCRQFIYLDDYSPEQLTKN